MELPEGCAQWGHGRITSVWSSLSEDILRFLNKSPENQASGDTVKTRLSALLTPQLLCLVVYRISHYLHVSGWKRMGTACARLNMIVHKANIPADSCIGPGCFLPHPAAVTFYGIGGRGLTLYSRAVCLPAWRPVDGAPTAAPELGNRVTIGAHSSVTGPVRLGSDTKVAFAVPVRRDAEAGAMVIAPEVWGNQISRRLAKEEVGV